jgi:hypothetical protein
METLMKHWDELSELEQLACLFSDFYKDVHGSRPRFMDDTWTVADYQHEIDGLQKYSEILANEEKEYLHKVANKAGIMDKISIPTPSKDKLEQDIHQFEVMKGELLAGNDSPELIKKFKLILLRLSKNGTIPKREASELMEELLQLGF